MTFKPILDRVKFYIVGGYVRDTIMGRRSKDVDFAVEAASFREMVCAIQLKGGEIYLCTEDYLTVRAKMPWQDGEVDADFVLCRKDGTYGDGRRPDTVEIGTLYDDLARRDFTCNAIALTEDGTYIDPHRGQEDIRAGQLRAVGVAAERFREDSLRILRAVRFSVTHGLALTNELIACIEDPEMVALLDNVSEERIKDELFKMLKVSTPQTLMRLEYFKALRTKIFSKRIWLMPTMKKRRT